MIEKLIFEGIFMNISLYIILSIPVGIFLGMTIGIGLGKLINFINEE